MAFIYYIIPIKCRYRDVIGIFDSEDHRKNFFDDKIDFIGNKVKRAIEIFLEDHPYMTHSKEFAIEQDDYSKEIKAT